MFWSLVAQTYPADEIVLVFDGAVTPELEAVVSEIRNQITFKLSEIAKKFRFR